MTLTESLSGSSFYHANHPMCLYNGLEAFEERWRHIALSGGGRAAAIVARAALFTTNEICEFGPDVV